MWKGARFSWKLHSKTLETHLLFGYKDHHCRRYAAKFTWQDWDCPNVVRMTALGQSLKWYYVRGANDIKKKWRNNNFDVLLIRIIFPVMLCANISMQNIFWLSRQGGNISYLKRPLSYHVFRNIRHNSLFHFNSKLQPSSFYAAISYQHLVIKIIKSSLISGL